MFVERRVLGHTLGGDAGEVRREDLLYELQRSCVGRMVSSWQA